MLKKKFQENKPMANQKNEIQKLVKEKVTYDIIWVPTAHLRDENLLRGEEARKAAKEKNPQYIFFSGRNNNTEYFPLIDPNQATSFLEGISYINSSSSDKKENNIIDLADATGGTGKTLLNILYEIESGNENGAIDFFTAETPSGPKYWNNMLCYFSTYRHFFSDPLRTKARFETKSRNSVENYKYCLELLSDLTTRGELKINIEGFPIIGVATNDKHYETFKRLGKEKQKELNKKLKRANIKGFGFDLVGGSTIKKKLGETFPHSYYPWHKITTKAILFASRGLDNIEATGDIWYAKGALLKNWTIDLIKDVLSSR